MYSLKQQSRRVTFRKLNKAKLLESQRDRTGQLKTLKKYGGNNGVSKGIGQDS